MNPESNERKNGSSRILLFGEAIKITLNKSINTIGRSEQCDVVLADKKAISYFHCTLFIDNESMYLRDDNSRNGTFVNRRRIQPGTKVQVCDGDSIMLADTTFTLKIIAQISEPAEPRNPRVISFCSVEGGAGKTTLSLSLARALYQAGYAVLYVDAENMNTFQVDIHYQEYASSDFLKSMRSYENMSFRLLSKHFGKVGFFLFSSGLWFVRNAGN